MDRKVKLIVLGCGNRGNAYAKFAKKFPERAEITAIAEPREEYRNLLGDKYNVPMNMRFNSWEDVAKLPKIADAVLVCMQDDMHEAPAIAFAEKGYHLLLEKPMAPTEEACRNIVSAIKRTGVMAAVCHVLRYTRYTETLKDIINSGKIGNIISIQHLEPVGYWHQAHSFVRGNWRNEKESSFMLLAKCCHDLDWLRYIINSPCKKVQSFGSLRHFKKENQPIDAADRCVDCPKEIESDCPYSALKIYMRDRAEKGKFEWPLDVVSSSMNCESIMQAIKDGPYGRCVYACDNDVVDNQVVNMFFADGSTVGMTMTAFTACENRYTKIFGTRGMIETDSTIIKILDFMTDEVTTINTNKYSDTRMMSAHAGGDMGIMDSFVAAVANNDSSKILTPLEESIETHLMVFRAEKSRLSGQVEDIEY